jgi:hypothetical protein
LFINGIWTDAGGEERIALQVKHLTAVRFGDAGIAEKHGVVSQTLVCETDRRRGLTVQEHVSYPLS